MNPRLPQSVKTLGLVSLLTDVSSEMITPLLPAFLTTVLKAGPAVLGLVEGVAESTASLAKIVSGRLSDLLGRRKPLVVAGYSLSSAVRPLVAVAAAPWHVLVIRFLDRLGKGVRGAPRDALITQVTSVHDRGRAFGFHRALDHTGAMLGPLLASAILVFHGDLRLVFALAAIPAAASVLVLVLGVKESAEARGSADEALPRPAPPAAEARSLRTYLVILALFTLGNSSDAFLLLKAQEAGVGLSLVPILWASHQLVKALTSTRGGALSDRLGRKTTILLGWALYAGAYAGFAVAGSPMAIFLLFGLYGLFHAFTEGPERALVADLAADDERGRAFGLYHAVSGVMLLPASLMAGLLWERYGAAAAFLTGAALAALAALGLLFLVPEPRRRDRDRLPHLDEGS